MESDLSDAELVDLFKRIDKEMTSDPRVRDPKPLMLYANKTPYYLRRYVILRDGGKL